MKLKFATRPSALARWQTQWVISALQKAHTDLVCEEKIITTQGDKILDKPLPEIGGKGLFTQELESELLSGAVHCAVHSLKDLPVENPMGLTVGCIPARAEVRDALVSKDGLTLVTLPQNAVVGTSSLRRAQLLAAPTDLKIESLRQCECVCEKYWKAIRRYHFGRCGTDPLGLEINVTEWLSLDMMLPRQGKAPWQSMPRERSDDPQFARCAR
jgi:hydroxymethylbilane synthase